MERTTGRVVIACVALAAGAVTGGACGDGAGSSEETTLQQVDLRETLAGTAGVDAGRVLDQFTGTSLDGREVDARTLVEEHPVVLFVYLSEWCEDWRREAPDLLRLHRDYADRGFRVVARSEYSDRGEVEAMIEELDLPYPVLTGSSRPDDADEEEVRTGTAHYRLRTALGDDRKWGTPLNLVVVDGDLGRVRVVAGELVPAELEALLEAELQAGATAR